MMTRDRPLNLLLLLLAPFLPAGAWTRVPDMQQLAPSDAHQDAEQHWEGAVFWLDKRAAQGVKHDRSSSAQQRSLAAEGDEATETTQGLGGVAQDHPSLEGRTKSRRSYLNELVEATMLDTDSQVANVAFVKTHKTASTTLAAIMYRYAARHELKLSHFGGGSAVSLKSAAAKTKEDRQLVDIMHYHITTQGQYTGTWDEAVKYYRRIMRDPDDINFVTVLREPRSHLLSYYYYYIQPRNQISIEEFLMHTAGSSKDHKLLYNPLSAEFGVRTAEQLDSLISDTLPDFKLILLTERLEEGLLVLARMLHWHMIDLTYCDLNETKAGSRRWDGKPFVSRPHFDSLPSKA
ncbi:unnamed protein product, partial [Ectocarpus sp. 6 AP-2014]